MATPLAPDASANRQSLVEHSPSTVMALNVSRAESTQRPMQQRRRHLRVGRQEAEHRGHVRLDHPGAFGRAADGERAARRLHRDGVFLGKRVGRHDGARRLARPCRGRARPRPHGCPATTLSIFRPTPITPVDATSTCSGAQPSAAAVSIVMRSRMCHALVARAGVGAAAVDDDGRGRGRRCRSRWRRETSTGAALARLVVKMPAAAAGAVGGDDRQVERRCRLLDAAVHGPPSGSPSAR